VIQQRSGIQTPGGPEQRSHSLPSITFQIRKRLRPTATSMHSRSHKRAAPASRGGAAPVREAAARERRVQPHQPLLLVSGRGEGRIGSVRTEHRTAERADPALHPADTGSGFGLPGAVDKSTSIGGGPLSPASVPQTQKEKRLPTQPPSQSRRRTDGSWGLFLRMRRRRRLDPTQCVPRPLPRSCLGALGYIHADPPAPAGGKKTRNPVLVLPPVGKEQIAQ
jgi:hypothetical protein